MKRVLGTIIICLLSYAAIAQSTFIFQPKWKVGDKRTATIVRSEMEYLNGELTDESAETLPVDYEVIKETSTAYLVKVTLENVALQAVIGVYEKVSDELPKYRNLELIYQINKIGGAADLVNWKEARDYIKTSFDQIGVLLKKKDPDAEDYLKFIMKPILSVFESKEGIEGYMKGEIELLTMHYGINMVLNDTVMNIEMEPNPFNPAEEISTTHKYYLTEQGKGLYNINYSIQFDMTNFVAMMKQMMSELGNSIGVSDSSIAKKNAELDDITFDMINSSDYTYNELTGWLTQITHVSEVLGTDPKGKRRKIVKQEVIFK